jgi:hypothetical protein
MAESTASVSVIQIDGRDQFTGRGSHALRLVKQIKEDKMNVKIILE